jgi:class 3 adenylate cyclase
MYGAIIIDRVAPGQADPMPGPGRPMAACRVAAIPLRRPEVHLADTLVKTVLELDLVGYSDIARVYQQGHGSSWVADLNRQIQDFVDGGLRAVGANRAATVVKTTGDGAILVFDEAGQAHEFAQAVHQATRHHNADKTEASARRSFRMGAATGEITLVPLDGGGRDIAGTTIAVAVRLEAASRPGELLIDLATYDRLPVKWKRQYGPQEDVAGKRDERFQARRSVMIPAGGESRSPRRAAETGVIAPQVTSNPFTWRSGITSAEGFFDRDNEQGTLRSYLRGRQNCQVVGPRRIGKTSLLRQVDRVARAWETTAVVAYLDLQDPRCHTLARWLRHASRQWGWADPAPADLAEFADRLDGMRSAGRFAVLCLDEFEELGVRRGEFTRDFLLTLRSSAQAGMSIVTASQSPLSALTDAHDPTSPFYNTFPLLRLGPFADRDAADFVTIRRPGVLPFTPEEKAVILAFAKGHPLALQVACFHVVEAKQNGESPSVAMQKVEDDMRAHLRNW